MEGIVAKRTLKKSYYNNKNTNKRAVMSGRIVLIRSVLYRFIYNLTNYLLFQYTKQEQGTELCKNV